MAARFFANYLWAAVVLLWMALLVIILAAGVFARPSYSTDAAGYFSTGFLSQASAYNRLKLLAYVIDRVVFATYAFIIFFLGWKYLQANPLISIKRAILSIAIVLVFLYIVTFPISFWRSFLIERQFGLTEQPLGMWIIDYLKGFMVSFIIAFIGLSGLYALIYYFPKHWWFLAFLAVMVFILFGTVLYPVVIAPLFYNFEPLRDQYMEKEIKNMAEQAGIEVEAILVADASRRTNKANAYFSGLARTKQIVIYDNLIDHFSREQSLAVIAHEMGHWKMMHLFKWFLISSASSFAFLFAINKLAASMGSSGFMIILIAFLAYSLLSVAVLPVENLISRQFEKEADRISLQLTKNPEESIQLFISLARTNYSNVEPNPWVKYILYSHPPIMERIDAVKSYQ
ncbi:MAG: M48 family metallopeptidase [Actinomycetota bacterium]